MLRKAPTVLADEVVLDLEDGVAATAKDRAREAVIAALSLSQWSRQTVAVRVNAPRTPWCHHDIQALAKLATQPVSLVVPKVEAPGDLEFIERLLDGSEAGRVSPLRVQALIETPAGLSRVDEIAAASERVDALILGYADLAASLGISRPALADPQVWRAAQERVLLAARTHGLQAIDGPYLGVEPDKRFVVSARQARDMGFDGKWAIHPSQVLALTEAFTPAPEEVEWASAVIDALARAERDSGSGAVPLGGEMVDEAMRVAALRVLARSSSLGAE